MNAIAAQSETRPEPRPAAPWRDIYYTVHDGLRLYARDYGPRHGDRLPVLCLAGLTRNSRDFHDLAVHLAASRRVLVPDYRGRGRSDQARDWRTYTPLVELSDTLALMTLAGVHECVVVGTSRGGIIAMVMAAARPGVLKGVILNDIGPELASQGLLRIRGHLEHAPKPAGWADAVDLLRKSNSGFEQMSEADWLAFARRVFRDSRGVPKPDYDTNLRRTFISYDDIVYDRIPRLWPQFAAMSHLPALVVRGENSDLLTADIVERMKTVHPQLKSLVVKHRGHAPFLNEPGVQKSITSFLDRIDAARLRDRS